MRPISSMTSAALVTQRTPSSRSNWWHPTDKADVIGPGTTMRTRSVLRASAAVDFAPLRAPASTTTVPGVIAAMTRLRVRKRCRMGAHPGGHSLTTAPLSRIRSNSRSCPRG